MSFAQHVHKMSNSELIGLAKNRFIDEDTQLAIAQHHYLRARQYLAENCSLTESVVDTLLAGKANSVKLVLCNAGHLNDRQEDIREVYFKLPPTMRQPWRMLNCFIKPMWRLNHHHEMSYINSPSDVLDDIYYSSVLPAVKRIASEYRTHYNSSYYIKAQIAALIEHPNTSDSALLSISQLPGLDMSVTQNALRIVSERRQDTNN